MTFGLNFSLVMHIKKEWSPGGLCHLLSPTEHPGKCEGVRTQQTAPKNKVHNWTTQKGPRRTGLPNIHPGESLSVSLLLLLLLNRITPEKVKLLNIPKIKYISIGLLVWTPISSFSYHLLYGLSIFIFKALFYYQFNLVS